MNNRKLAEQFLTTHFPYICEAHVCELSAILDAVEERGQLLQSWLMDEPTKPYDATMADELTA